MRSQNSEAINESLVQEFYNVLNTQRASFKKKPISKYNLGEIILQELLQGGIQSSQDQNFAKILANYQKFNLGNNLDYLFYEDSHKPKGYQFTSQEITDCFMKTLDDMINGPFKTKILTGISQTNISFGLLQTGQKGENFIVVALTTKQQACIDGVINCMSQSDSGLLICGKVLDMSKKPAFITINRENQNQLVIGPNRIMYSNETSEFRAHMPDNYCGRSLGQYLQAFDTHNVIEIFLTDCQNGHIQLGEGPDINQDFNQFNCFEIGYSDILPDFEQFEKRQGGLSMLLQQQNLFNNSSAGNQQTLRQNTRSVTQPNSLSAGAPQIRTTRAQQIRQNAALMKQQTQPASVQSRTFTSSSGNNNNLRQMNPNFNRGGGGAINNNAQTPQINRSQSFTVSFNNKPTNSNTFQTPTFNNNVKQNNNFNNNNNLNNNENKNPNMSFQFNANQSKQNFNTVNGNNGVNFNNNNQNQVQPFKINFNVPNNGGTANSNNQFASSSNSAFSRAPQNPNFQFNASTTQNFNQQQFKPNFGTSNNSNNNTNWNNNQNSQGFKPYSNNFGNNNSNNNFNQSQGFQPQKQQFNFQSNFNNGNNFSYNNNSSSNNFSNNNNGNFANNFNQFNNQWQQYQNQQNQYQVNQQQKIQQQQQQQQNQQQPAKEHQVFSQLSPIDQETLKGYLKNLSQDLNPDQVQKVTALMLTDPVQFFNYYKAAVEQFEQSKAIIKNSKNGAESKQIDINTTTTGLDSKISHRLKEYDDLTLFLYTMPEKLKKNDEVKYQQTIRMLQETQLTPKQAIKKLVIRNRQPINESFKKLYLSKQHSDLILSLRGEEFLCHQIVFTSNSEFFKKAIRESETINKITYGADAMLASKLLIPEWIEMAAFKQFILYMYTGKVGVDGNYQQMNEKELIDLLRVGNCFFNEYLQEFLIAQVIIPHMTPTSSVFFLKECTYNQKYHRNSCLNAWAFLKAYSRYYLEKHLPSLIRTNPTLLYDSLDANLMREIVDYSLLYIVDAQKDMESILQFTAEYWQEKKITALFRRSQESMDSCSAFDYQLVPLMSDFLRTIDVNLDYKCQLIKSQDVITSAQINKTASQTASTESMGGENKKTDLDSTFVQGVVGDTQPNDIRSENDLSQWKPSANIIKENISSKDFFDSKYPCIHQQINLEQLKVDFEKNKGATIITKAFDFGRRSWHLKIDIDYENNVSLWIVERGPILSSSTDGIPQIGVNIPVKFSSVLMQFEILDAAFGEYKSLIFYTFAHDQNQIIGHQNFINLNQLKEKGELNIKCYLREFVLHSSLTYYICQNFQNLYKKDLKILEVQKKNYLANKNSFFYNHPNIYNEYELLSLAFYNVFQLFQSQDLKVEDENLVLGYLFHYTKIQSITNNDENMKFIANLLVQTLKFYYISTKKILSALRDNNILRQSHVFINKAIEEFNLRFQNQNQLILNINGNTSKSNQVKEYPRKYYDMSKVQNQGRTKQQLNPDQNKIHPFITDLVNWLQTSHHTKLIDEPTFLNEIRKQIIEDRRKNSDNYNQGGWANYYQNYNRDISPRQDYYKRTYYRTYSNDPRQQQQNNYNYNNNLNQQPIQINNVNGGSQRSRTPPKFLQQNKNDKLNTSYDYYLRNNNIGGNYLATNGSYHQAENKLRNNLVADYSMLLNNLDQSGAQYGNQNNNYNKGSGNYYNQTKYHDNNNNGGAGYVPYYRQDRRYENNPINSKYNQSSKSSGTDDGCCIF